MRIFLEAQNETETKLLGGDSLKIEGASVGVVMARCLEGGVLPKEHSMSWGDDINWLVGKLEVAKHYFINSIRGLN